MGDQSRKGLPLCLRKSEQVPASLPCVVSPRCWADLLETPPLIISRICSHGLNSGVWGGNAAMVAALGCGLFLGRYQLSKFTAGAEILLLYFGYKFSQQI